LLSSKEKGEYMKKLLVFISALFCSKIALADAGIPLLVFTRPFAVCAIIPVVLIEYLYYIQKYKNLSHLGRAVIEANFVSTFAGWFLMIPIAFLAVMSPLIVLSLPFIIDIWGCYRYLRHKEVNKQIVLFGMVFSLIVMLYLLGGIFYPNYFNFVGELGELGEKYFWWWEGKKNSALILLPSLIGDFFISWWMEYGILKGKFAEIERENLKKSVLIANIYSYIFLFIIVVVYYL